MINLRYGYVNRIRKLHKTFKGNTLFAGTTRDGIIYQRD